jgi:hypothetical protein
VICQKVILRKYRTADGRWDISTKSELPPLDSVFWVQMNTWAKRALNPGQFPIMSVVLEDGKTWVPVEVMDFTNEWEDRT